MTPFVSYAPGGLIKEALVVTHHHLRFDLLYSLQRNADHDDDGRAAHGKAIHAGEVAVKDRQDRNEREENRADERYLGKDLADELRRRTARTDAGDRTVIGAEVVRHFNRVVLDRHVEVSKHNDEQQVQNTVQPTGGGEGIEEALPEAGRFADKEANGARNGEDRRREDDRHNTAHGHFDRQERALTAVNLSANDLLSILHRNAALGIVHENDDPNDREEKDDEQRCKDKVLTVALRRLHCSREVAPDLTHRNRKTCDDTGKQDDGNAVAYALLVDLLTHPHDQRRAGGERENNNDCSKYCGETFLVQGNVIVSQVEIISGTLNEAETHRGVSRNGSNFLSAFFAFLRHALQGGNRHREELNDDGRVDVRGDAHCKQRCICERAAR